MRCASLLIPSLKIREPLLPPLVLPRRQLLERLTQTALPLPLPINRPAPSLKRCAELGVHIVRVARRLVELE